MTASTTSVSPKASLYSSTLDSARRRRLFSHAHPANLQGRINVGSTAGAGGMDWKELLRKFGKHNPHREVVTSAASLDQTLHSLLSKAAPSSPSSTTPTSPTALPSPLPTASHPPLQTSLSALTATLASGTGTPFERNSAKIVRAHALFRLGQVEESLKEVEGCERECPSSGEGEGYDLTLRVLGWAVEGFAREQLGQDAPAREAYVKAARVYDEACDILLASHGTLKEEVELHHVGEAVVVRLCLCENLKGSDPLSSYPFHKLYHRRLSPHTSSTSPTTHLALIHSSRALILSHSKAYDDLSALNLAEEYILRKTTKLPKAGKVNGPYLKFLDQVAQGWKASGAGREGAEEVVKIMYNALTHTFQSQRLLRHLARALVALGSYVEAGKAVDLYVDLWDKSKETDAKAVAREMAGGEVKEAEEEVVVVDEADVDEDRQFVEFAVWGTRVFERLLRREGRAFEIAERVKEVVDADATLKEDSKLGEVVERALGVTLGSLVRKEADSRTRAVKHERALAHLRKALTYNPTSSSTLYSLSFLLAETRDVVSALDYARQAVQALSPSASRTRRRELWHWLGLLVISAQKDYEGALQVLETALDEEDDDEDNEDGQRNGVVGGGIGGSLLGLDEADPDQYELFRDQTSVLEAEVQIRMTKNVVIEFMEGPEAALLDQQALLAFYAAAVGEVKELETAAASTAPPSEAPTSEPTSPRKLAPSLLGRARSIRSSTPVNGGTQGLRSVSTGTANSLAPPVAVDASLSSLSINNPTSPTSSSSGPVSGALATTPRGTKVLVDLWLMSAASYRRAGKLDESLGAISEAESLDATDPDVWAQLATYHLALSSTTNARTSLLKALSFDPSHLTSQILLARLHLTSGSKGLPHAALALSAMVDREGYDSPEAWFELSRCYKEEGRKDKEREALVTALGLERTRSVRPWEVCERGL